MDSHRRPPKYLSRLQRLAAKADARSARRAVPIDTESDAWKVRESKAWLSGGATAVLKGTHKGGEHYLSGAVAKARAAGMADEDILEVIVAVVPAERLPEKIRKLLEKADG